MQEQLPLTFSYRPAYGRNDFLVAPCNVQAVRWIDQYPNWPMPAVIICGEAGSGKSHLASVFSSVRLEGASLTHQQALTVSEPKIVVENIENIRDEEALFHLYNQVVAQGGALLMTARKIPCFQLKDLQSRLNAVPKIYISMPDEELIYAVLYKAFQDRGVLIPPRVLEYAVVRLPRSFDTVRRVIEQADLLSLSRGQRVTIPLMKRAIEQVSSLSNT